MQRGARRTARVNGSRVWLIEKRTALTRIRGLFFKGSRGVVEEDRCGQLRKFERIESKAEKECRRWRRRVVFGRRGYGCRDEERNQRCRGRNVDS